MKFKKKNEPIDIWFATLQPFSKPEILNSLKSFNKSLIRFIAASMCIPLVCNNLLTSVPPECVSVPLLRLES